MKADMERALEQTRKAVQNYKDTSGIEGICPVREIMDRVGRKWSVLLLFTLAERPHRFGELRRAVPEISQRMLTQTLAELQDDDLVARQVFDTKPPGVEYRLTELGQSLLVPLASLFKWADTNQDHIARARSGT